MLSFSDLKQRAFSFGVDDLGVCPYEYLEEDKAFLQRFLKDGRQAGMSYLERNLDVRSDPRLLLQDCQSVIVVLMYYGTVQNRCHHPKISLYAQGEDYHRVLMARLRKIETYLQSRYSIQTRSVVDSTPVFEKAWAVRAGLGYIGRNSLLIHPRLGSLCFIGIVLCNQEFDQYSTPLTAVYPPEYSFSPDTFPPSLPLESHPCAHCRNCIDRCPNHALDQGMDARKCFSYLSIEHKGDFPEDFPRQCYPGWYGCDICQKSCPVNRRVSESEAGEKFLHPEFLASDTILKIHPERIAKMSNSAFKKDFANSPLLRLGLKRLKRNMGIDRKEDLT